MMNTMQASLPFRKLMLFCAFFLISPISWGQEGNASEWAYLEPQNSGKSLDSQALRDIFLHLEKDHEVRFAINDKLIADKFAKVDYKNVKNLDRTLQQILSPLGLTYKKIKGYYVIITKEEQASKAPISIQNYAPLSQAGSTKRLPLKQTNGDAEGNIGLYLNAQQYTASGKVVSAKEDFPLPGVSVNVKGTNRSTTTDINGNYSISVPTEQAILVFSYVGYTTQEINLDGVLRKDVQMDEDVRILRDVLINVPYGQQTKASYTGSAATVEAKTIENRPRESFENSLQGNVAGLQVMSSTGQPGAAPNVRIRGISSINGNNSPLYVVDGVPVLSQSITTLATSSNTLAGINPNDIESITVLKDASAASIYGSLGANGVIMITTKGGSSGKTRVNFSAQYGMNQMTRSDISMPLTTAEMSELLIEGVINSTSLAPSTPEDAYTYLVNNGLDPNTSVDWFDIVTQTGRYDQYNVSASGGNDKTRFYVSAGYYNRDAVTKGQDFSRKNIRLSLNNQASERLSFSGRISASRQDLSTVPAAGTGQNPVRSLYRIVPWIGPYTETGEYNPRINHNPEIVRLENKYETKISQLISNLSATYKFNDNLSFESRGGQDYNYSEDFRFWSPLSPDGLGSNGRGAEYSTVWDNWSITNLLKYRGQYKDFSINATLGQEASKRNLKRVSTQANNYAADGLYTLANTSEPYIAWSTKSSATLVSYFLNTSFSYQQKYYLNATVRRDGSSRFGRNVRYGNFWSIGGAWNAHEETFMKEIPVINQLKLRASYGVSGSQLGEYYGHMGYYGTGSKYGGLPGFSMAQIESGDLSWEKNHPLDIGLEFAVLDNRLSGTIDWYTRKTTDLFMDMPVSYTNGVSNLNFNVGSMQNTGIEIALNSENIRPKVEDGFGWQTSFNISTQKNKVLKVVGDRMVSGRYLRENGGDFYQFYMRGYAGIDRDTGESLWFTNGDRTNTTTDYTEAAPFKQNKSALAKFYGGLTNTFQYKGFSLSALIYFTVGGHIYDTWGTYTQNDGSVGLNAYGQISRVYYENRWKQPGDAAEYPKMVYLGSQSGLNSQHSSRFLYNGTYVRLRDVTLSYDLPLDRMKLKMNSAQIYLRANNLYTWVYDDLLPYDPEVGIAGLLDQNLPVSKQFIVGINLTF